MFVTIRHDDKRIVLATRLKKGRCSCAIFLNGEIKINRVKIQREVYCPSLRIQKTHKINNLWEQRNFHETIVPLPTLSQKT